MTTTTIETTILRNLIHNEEFVRKVLPFLKEEYFSQSEQKFVFSFVNDFVKKYNKPATIEALEVSLQNSSLNEGQFSEVSSLLKALS
jgi:replicative DNA helicase